MSNRALTEAETNNWNDKISFIFLKYTSKAGFPLANIFARSDVFPLSLSFRLKPSGTNRAQTKEKSRFARKYSLVENRLNVAAMASDVNIDIK